MITLTLTLTVSEQHLSCRLLDRGRVGTAAGASSTQASGRDTNIYKDARRSRENGGLEKGNALLLVLRFDMIKKNTGKVLSNKVNLFILKYKRQ